jgi:hypothetical protein
MLALAAVALANGVAFIPGAGALWGAATTALGYLVRCKPCLWALATAALCAWTAIHIHRADAVACTGRIEDDHRRAELARLERDKDIREDLDKTYRPKIDGLTKLNATLKKQVDNYAKPKPVAKAAGKAVGGCKLGDAAGLLQPSQSR